MSWYNTEGALSHHVIRSETKYIRNFQSLRFSHKVEKKQFEALRLKLEKLLENNGFKKESFAKGDLYKLFSFAEKGFCDADASMLKNSVTDVSDGAHISSDLSELSLFFNEPCSLSVSVGGRDLLVIRSLLSGKAVKETQSIALEAEELFDREFEFAYSEAIGYLSPSVSNCGSGEYFSTLLYLPGLQQLGDIERIRSLAYLYRASVFPLISDSENSGDMYIVSHSPTHLCNHFQAAQGFDALVSLIVEKEKAAESMIFAERGKLIIENAYRAYGALAYTRHISESDMLSLLSSIRLCLAVSPSEHPPLSLCTINLLLANGMNFSVMSNQNDCTSYAKIEECRAKIISKELERDTATQ